MLLGYNTNGFANHDALDAIEILAELGYRSVALTLDHGRLNPLAGDFDLELERIGELLEKHRLRSVIETGARFLLDPRAKHEPTLVTADDAGRELRVAFYRRAIDAARRLGSDCVSLWSGVVREGANRRQAHERLVRGLGEVLDYAAGQQAGEREMPIGFEPEPGMLIDTMASYEKLVRELDAPHFALTLDVGHLHCQGELPIAAHIARWKSHLVNVHIEDMRPGVHEHLMFGEGDVDFPPIFRALEKADYQGGVHVELSRHSHIAPEAAQRAMAFLAPLAHAQKHGS